MSRTFPDLLSSFLDYACYFSLFGHMDTLSLMSLKMSPSMINISFDSLYFVYKTHTHKHYT